MGKLRIIFFFLPFYLFVSVCSSLEIDSHRLNIEITPEKNWIKVKDRVVLKKGPDKNNSFEFFLNSKLVLSEVLYKEKDQEKNIVKHLKIITLGNPFYIHYLLRLPALAEDIVLEFVYEGEIFDRVEKSKDLSFVIGDRTKGIISKEGIFLVEESGWYINRHNSLSLFENIEVTVKEPYEIVTQGELINRKIIKGINKTVWKNEIPAPGLDLIGGIYSIESQMVDGVKISTYFFPSERGFAKDYLQAAASYIRYYSQILGKFPYKKYDIVENFFTSGYGMPSFTLLGPGVIKRGKESLKPGYLDHEIVHSWWGNYIYYDPDLGNWCEALTTYFANYLPLEEEDALKAMRYRRLILQKYSSRVNEKNEYSIREFSGKEKEIDDDIGYAKGMMVFHMLRKKIGDKPFFSATRNIIRNYGGKRAAWEDFQKEFEKEANLDLKIFFDQWINRKGAPIIELKDFEFSPRENKFHISGNIYQGKDSDLYDLNAVIKIFLPGKILEQEISLKERKTFFEFILDSKPNKVLFDPDFHLFRRIPRDSLPANLNLLLEEPQKVFILPEKEEVASIYKSIIEQVRNETDEIFSADKFPGEDLGKNSLFIFGTPQDNPVLKDMLKDKNDLIAFEPDTIILQGERYEGNTYSFLLSFRNPYANSRFITIYGGFSPEALKKIHFIYYYGWDSFVIFQEGKMIKRGYLESNDSFTPGFLLEYSK